MNRYCLGLAAWLATTASLAAPADDRPVEQVIVSATRSPQANLNIATPVIVITADEIAATGANHLIDILESQAGIQVQDRIGNGSRGAVSMRGFADSATNNTLILVDGRKLNNPTMEAADLNSIAVHDIERIEIVQGSAGVLFGEQAVGGVINIITKRPGRQQLRIEAFTGSHELDGLRASVSQGFGNGLAFRLSGEKKQSDNYRDNNETDYENLMGQLDYTGARGSAFAEFQSVNDDLRLPGAISSDNPWDPLPQLTVDQKLAIDRKQTDNPNDFSDTRTNVVRIGGSLRLTDNLSLAAEYGDRDSDGRGFQFGTGFTQDTRVKTFSPRLIGEWETSRGPLLLTAGYDQQDSAFRYDQPGFLYFLSNEQRLKDLYAQLVLPLAQGLALTAGARHSEAQDEDLLRGIGNRESEVATELGLSWQFTPHARLFLRNADGFRFASVDENGLTPPGQLFLDPQTSNSWDLGYEWSHAGHGVRVLLYDMQLSNEIVFDPSVPGPWFPGANVNLDESRRRGAVLEGRAALGGGVTLRANATFTDAEITSGLFRGNAVPFVSEHTGTVALEWDIGGGWSSYVDAHYTGSRYQGNDDANAAARISAYWTWNANLRWQGGGWDAKLRLNNLGGEQYEAYRSIYGAYPAAEATAELRVAYTF